MVAEMKEYIFRKGDIVAIRIGNSEAVELYVVDNDVKQTDQEVLIPLTGYFDQYKYGMCASELILICSSHAKDSVNSENSTDTNAHYSHGVCQPIEFIQSVLSGSPATPFEAACLKDIIKYSSRYGYKKDNSKQQESAKIVDYALWLLLESKGIKVDPRIHNHQTVLKAFGIE